MARIHPQGMPKCRCGAEMEQVGQGDRFELPTVRVGTVGATAVHGHGRGMEVNVFRCPTCRRIELYDSGGGSGVTFR